MRPPESTLDSSCIIALDSLDLLPQLSFLFSRALLPQAVRKELHRRRRTKDRLRRLRDSYAFLENCDEYDKATVDMLLLERSGQILRDRGEAEAVVQAASNGTMVITDDAWGRSLAASYNLECHGTIWILRRLFEMGLLTASAVRRGFVDLGRGKIRLPRDTVNAFLIEIGEFPLAEN